MRLSILIPTLPARFDLFQPLVQKLEKQIADLGTDQVEILGLLDNKKSSVGRKRNQLLDLAQGEFLTFVDDDDDVSDDYISQLLFALEVPDIDLVLYDVLLQYQQEPPRNQAKEVRCRYDQGLNNGRNIRPSFYEGPPAHTHAWRASKVKHLRFPDKNFGEDSDWSLRAKTFVEKVVRIDKTLYFYKFDKARTETRDGR